MTNFKKNFQSFGKSLLFPISLLSFMAIFLGLAAALQNPNIIKYVGFLANTNIQNVLGLIRKLAALPFGQLPVLFALAIPLGMVKRDRGVAVYSALVGYISMLIGMNYILQVQGFTSATTSVAALMETGLDQVDATLLNSMYTSVLGIFVYNMNVIGGIIAGVLTVIIHNKFRETELHSALSFYSGKRFVPIISALLMVLVGVALTFVWPAVNSVIIASGKIISEAGIFGAFLYGFVEKLINPTGLHHILNQTFRFTALGGVETAIDGKSLVGALQIYLYQLENHLPFSTSATQYLAQGKILHMVFGMPAAVFAIYKSALPEKRDRVLKFFIAGLTAVILTGITEPIEFTFIFISPILWIVNAIFAGLAFFVPALLNVGIGNIQGGIIDWLVFGVLQGTATKWYIYLVVGPIFFAMYYFTYSFIIKKFNVMTVGRRETDFVDEDDAEGAVVAQADQDIVLAMNIVNGLGGAENIVDVDNCISRLRVEVKDDSLVDDSLINKTSPNGIVRPGKNNIHVVYGGRITKVRNVVDNYLYNLKKD